jgi:hypothetical protein
VIRHYLIGTRKSLVTHGRSGPRGLSVGQTFSVRGGPDVKSDSLQPGSQIVDFLPKRNGVLSVCVSFLSDPADAAHLGSEGMRHPIVLPESQTRLSVALASRQEGQVDLRYRLQ